LRLSWRSDDLSSAGHAADHEWPLITLIIVMSKPYPQNLWITLWISSQNNIAYFEKVRRILGEITN